MIVRQIILFVILLIGSMPLNAVRINRVKLIKNVYQNKKSTKTDFADSIKSSSKRLGVPSDWLLAICSNESQFKTDAKNKFSSAVGIIQFTNGTARKLGTSVSEIKKMGLTQQLHYAEKYFAKGMPFKSLTDMYMFCLLPSMRKHSDNPNAVIIKSGDMYYQGNAGLDTNKDGEITVGEVGKRINQKLDKIKKGVQPSF